MLTGSSPGTVMVFGTKFGLTDIFSIPSAIESIVHAVDDINSEPYPF